MNLIKLPGLKEPVSVQSIVLIQGNGNYSIFRFDNNQEYTAVETLKQFEKQLTSFIRIHKHWLINPLFVSRFEQQTAKIAQVTIRDSITLSVARRRINAVKMKIDGVLLSMDQ